MKIKEIKTIHINMELDYKEVAIRLIEGYSYLANEGLLRAIRKELKTIIDNYKIENNCIINASDSRVYIFNDDIKSFSIEEVYQEKFCSGTNEIQIIRN